jgi:Transmembrane amino acid transporter protein
MGLDSYEYPAKNYGDLAFRTYGRVFRYIVNFLQALQLMLSVGVIVIGNGQSISQVSKFRLCYVVCCLIWSVVGFGMGQIRTLQKFGWLANGAVFLNLMIMFISMGVMAHSPPNFAISVLGSAGGATNPALITPNAAGVYPPITKFGGVPPSVNGFIGQINGLMQGVYAYAGAQLFIEFMAELRRPRDFLKAMWGAQFFIYSCYMIYGCYTYFWQGQYSYQVSLYTLSLF